MPRAARPPRSSTPQPRRRSPRFRRATRLTSIEPWPPRAAFETWSQSTPQDRSKALYAFADAIERDTETLSLLEQQNVGKPKGTADFDVEFTVDNVRFFAGRRTVVEEGRRRVRQHPHEHDPARAGGRRRPGGAMELPADDGDLEAVPGDRGWLHGRPQAVVVDAALGDPPRRACGRHLPEGRVQRRHRPGRWSGIA